MRTVLLFTARVALIHRFTFSSARGMTGVPGVVVVWHTKG